MFAARLRAYAPGGAALGLLPDPLSWQASVVHGDLGALSVTYSTLTAGGPLVERPLADGLEVAVEVWNGTTWVEPRGCRFVRVAQGSDTADDMQVYTLTFRAYGWLLSKARLTAGTFTDGRRVFTAPLAGDLVGDILAENATIGGVPVTVIGGGTTDAGGANWPALPDQGFEYAADYLGIVRGLQEAGALDWATQARGLYLYLPDSAALSPDLSGTVRLRLGRDIGQAPADETIESLVSQVAVRAQAGGTVVVDEPTAPTPWGEWQGSLSVGQVDDQSAAEAMGEAELERSGRAREQYTRDLILHDGAPIPLVDYWPGSWVTAPTNVQAESVRVQQVTLTFGDGGYGGNVVLNDRLVEGDIRRARTLATLAGGQVGAGGAPAPIAVDPEASRVPVVPTGFVTVTGVSFTGPTPRGVLTATWNPVTTATDGGALVIAGYEFQWRDADDGEWQTIFTSELGVSVPDLEPGLDTESRVRAVGARTTFPSAYTTVEADTIPGDTTAPPVPTGLSMTSERGVLKITWDGTPTMPVDFAALEIFVGPTSTPTTYVGRLTGPGTLLVSDTVGATRYARARTRDTTPNFSAYGAATGPVTVASVVEADIDSAVTDAIDEALTGPVDGSRVTPWTIGPERLLIGLGENSILDPGFESGTNLWHLQSAGGSSKGTSSTARSGAFSGRFVIVNGSTTRNVAYATQNGSLMAQNRPVKVGDNLRGSLWARLESGTATARAIVHIRNAAAGLVQTISPASVALSSSEWTLLAAEGEVTAATAAYAHLTLAVTDSASAIILVDDSSLRTRMTGELVVDGAIKTRALDADAVDASVVKTGSLSADLLEGVLALVNKLIASETQSETGQRIELDPSGLRFYTADDQVWIELPTAAGSTPQFRGAIEANGLIVREGATFYSAQNEFARGAKIALAEQVSGPLAGPTPTFTWEGVQLERTAFTDSLGTFALDPSQICGVGRDLRSGSNRITIMQKRPNGTRMWFYNMDGTLANLIVGGELHPFTDYVDWEVTGGIIDDSQSIWFGKWATNNEWYFRKTDGTYTRYPSANPTTRNVMGWNGTDYLVAEKISTTAYRFRRVAPTGTDVTVLENVNSTGLGPLTPALCFIYRGSADFGSTKWVVSHQDQNVFRPFTSAGAYDADHRWDPPGQKMGGFWNASDSRFYTVGADGILYKHSSMTWTDPVLDTWHVGQSFYDANATGGTHESALGAITSFAMKKRATVRLSLADVPYSGEVDDPNQWRLYAKRGAAPASNFSDMRLQTSGSYTVHTTVMSSFPTTGGTAALQFGTFPDGAPAMLQSARTLPGDPTKRIIDLRGDGSGRFGPLEVDDSGVLVDTRDVDWTELPLAGGRSHVASFQAQYCRVGGIVHLRGRVSGVTGTGARSIGTLPAGFRPPSDQSTYELGMFAMNGAVTDIARLFVDTTTGVVSCNLNPTSQNTIFLGGSFPVGA